MKLVTFAVAGRDRVGVSWISTWSIPTRPTLPVWRRTAIQNPPPEPAKHCRPVKDRLSQLSAQVNHLWPEEIEACLKPQYDYFSKLLKAIHGIEACRESLL